MDEENGVYTVTLKVWREASAAPRFARQVELPWTVALSTAAHATKLRP